MPLHRLAIPARDQLPSFAIGSFETIGPLSLASFPHRHTFYEVVHVTEGGGAHVVDFAEEPLRPPHLCVITPGQVHFWQQVQGVQGRVVLFTDEFLIPHPDDRDALHALAARPWLHLAGEDADAVAYLVGEMHREYLRRETGFISVLQSYLHILLTRAVRLLDARPPQGGTSRAVVVAQRFTRLLGINGPADTSVRAYAARVGVSVSYLNEVVKEVTGSTPGQLIRQAQALEAKRLLGRTGLTVAQVARQLGFADPAYFCRFFRRETGVSPGEFRRSVGGNHHNRRTESIEGPDSPG
ncbi:MAG TPA: helix-turn-helix domain-containing protein [Pilimelia sp.]|nr:helix-turn-helix domain-containing protein [Pilimelia sp.]